MKTKDVKIGARVKWNDAVWVVVDKHPRIGHWWLQCSTTGQVDLDWFAHSRDLDPAPADTTH